MTVDELRADFGRLEIVHTADEPWVESPSPGVSRKRLHRIGPPESGQVTSVVRYAPGSRFPEHPHPQGEEILVLDGVFSDVRGDHPAGAYLLNPEGFVHAPYSGPGCTLFVKLRQYAGLDRETLCLHTASEPWQVDATTGEQSLTLYSSPRYAETMSLRRLPAGAALPPAPLPGGAEVFVLRGDFSDAHGDYRQGSWVRYPAGSTSARSTNAGCTLYIKAGHLP